MVEFHSWTAFACLCCAFDQPTARDEGYCTRIPLVPNQSQGSAGRHYMAGWLTKMHPVILVSPIRGKIHRRMGAPPESFRTGAESGGAVSLAVSIGDTMTACCARC